MLAIDGLQKNNLAYLESLESEGYSFRSQIITEFDREHATQDVNIKLSEDYTYLIVGIGDINILSLTLAIKPSQKAKMKLLDLPSGFTGQSSQVNPSRSGSFKIDITAADFKEDENGFISFMVLRK